MNRRFFRIVVQVLIAGQIFLSAPIVSAMTGVTGSHSVSVELPCADSMPPPPGADPCHCCTDGAMGTAACSSACMASVGMISAFELPVVSGTAPTPPLVALVHVARASDPPLKPPPIV